MSHLVFAIFQLRQFGSLYNKKGNARQPLSSCVLKLSVLSPKNFAPILLIFAYCPANCVVLMCFSSVSRSDSVRLSLLELCISASQT